VYAHPCRSTKPGERPVKPDIASIIRQAQNSTEHAGDAALDGGVGLDGATFKHTEVGDDARLRGGSTLGSNAVGTAALTAALTLHPCVHLSGCGDASKDVLHSMLSSVGGCIVALVVDEETGRPTGEASATFGSAAAAEAAIRRFDGSRLDDGVLHVSVAKRAAQGSLTTRGKGRGRGKGGGGGITFAERQRDMISEQRLAQAQDEKDAFAKARASQNAGGRGMGRGSVAIVERPSSFDVQGPASGPPTANEAGTAAKRRKVGGLPGVLMVKPGSSGATPAAPPASQPPPPSLPPSAGTGGGLLGLASYGSDEDDEEEDGDDA